MRPLLFAVAVVCVAVFPRLTSAEPPVVQATRVVQVVYEHATLEGLCTLVDVERQPDGLALYFITSARLFKDASGKPFMPAWEVWVLMDDGTGVAVPGAQRHLPSGNFSDVAVLRVDVAGSALQPATMSFSAPTPARAIEIFGFDREGQPQAQRQHVRFTSTRFIVGDRDLSTFGVCLGAPVMDDGDVIGVVSECEPGRAPLVTPLSIAFPFLSRQIPRLTARPTAREQP